MHLRWATSQRLRPAFCKVLPNAQDCLVHAALASTFQGMLQVHGQRPKYHMVRRQRLPMHRTVMQINIFSEQEDGSMIRSYEERNYHSTYKTEVQS